MQPAALPEILAGPAADAAVRYRWNRCIQVQQLDAAVNWGINCSCVSNSSNVAASPVNLHKFSDDMFFIVHNSNHS